MQTLSCCCCRKVVTWVIHSFIAYHFFPLEVSTWLWFFSSLLSIIIQLFPCCSRCRFWFIDRSISFFIFLFAFAICSFLREIKLSRTFFVRTISSHFIIQSSISFSSSFQLHFALSLLLMVIFYFFSVCQLVRALASASFFSALVFGSWLCKHSFSAIRTSKIAKITAIMVVFFSASASIYPSQMRCESMKRYRLWCGAAAVEQHQLISSWSCLNRRRWKSIAAICVKVVINKTHTVSFKRSHYIVGCLP